MIEFGWEELRELGVNPSDEDAKSIIEEKMCDDKELHLEWTPCWLYHLFKEHFKN
jgi:hypothetical protein